MAPATGERLGLGRDETYRPRMTLDALLFSRKLIYPLDHSSTLHRSSSTHFVLTPDAVADPVPRGALLVVRLRREKRAPTPSLRSDYGQDQKRVLSSAAPPGRSERLRSLWSLRCSTRTSLRAVRPAQLVTLQLSTERWGGWERGDSSAPCFFCIRQPEPKITQNLPAGKGEWNARTCPPKRRGGRTSRPSLWGEPTFLWNLPDGKRKKNTPLVKAGKRQNLGRGAAPSKPPPALKKVHKTSIEA